MPFASRLDAATSHRKASTQIDGCRLRQDQGKAANPFIQWAESGAAPPDAFQACTMPT
jgi:hypothetical protein